jgi:hypothetical protein
MEIERLLLAGTFDGLATLDAGPVQSDNPFLLAIETEIRVAVSSVDDAKRAYSAGDIPAGKRLEDRAITLYMIVLRQTIQLGETEADLIEPAFTQLEERLIGLSAVPEFSSTGAKTTPKARKHRAPQLGSRRRHL